MGRQQRRGEDSKKVVMIKQMRNVGEDSKTAFFALHLQVFSMLDIIKK